MIRTVLGDIPGSALGHAQCHEHLLVADTPAAKTAPALRFDDTALSIQELYAYKRAGGGAVVDAQPVGAGRMAGALIEAALRTGVHIVAVTGFHKRMFYAPDSPLLAMDAEQLAALYTSEVADGMLESASGERLAARAGLVKLAFDKDEPGGVRADWAEAAIAAAAAVRAPLMLHTEPGVDPLPLMERAILAGVPADKLIVCHLDRASADIGLHKAAARTGAYLDYDSIHRYKYISEADELALLRAMLEAGFGDRLLLSLDTTRERLASYGGGIGLDYILSQFLPALRAAGITPADLRQMTVLNPAAALSITA